VAARPILIIDTSVFLQDALSPSGAGSASHLLALAPAIAHVVICADIRDEIIDKLADVAGWSRAQVLERYGPILDAAVVVTPVDEREDHRRFVNDDAGDTMFVRTAEAIYEQAGELIEADQIRLIVSVNTHHLRPRSGYAGFLVRTPHDAVEVLTAG
jgi:predicted nucleic acid-binding protein